LPKFSFLFNVWQLLLLMLLMQLYNCSFLLKKRPPYTPVGFDLTTHSSSRLVGWRRRCH
jgi:hypothetical protein